MYKAPKITYDSWCSSCLLGYPIDRPILKLAIQSAQSGVKVQRHQVLMSCSMCSIELVIRTCLDENIFYETG